MTTLKNNRTARSRRVFAWMLGILIGSQTLAMLAFDYLIPSVRFPELYTMLARLPSGPDSPDLIVLGSSRFGGFVNDSELTHELRKATGDSTFRAFNASITAGDPLVQAVVFRELMNRRVLPRYVVLESSPEFFNAHAFMGREHARRMLNLEDAWQHRNLLVQPSVLSVWLGTRVCPLYLHRHQFVKQSLKGFAPLASPTPLLPRGPMTDDDELAYRRSVLPLTPQQDLAINQDKDPEQTFLRKFRFNPNAMRAVGEVLEVCQTKNIQVLIVNAPATANLRGMHSPEIVATYNKALDHLKVRSPFHFADLRDSMPDHAFCDIHHVADLIASAVFSRVLARETIAPWIHDSSTLQVRADASHRAITR